MTGPLHSNNLVPFKKRRDGYHLPGAEQDGEASTVERLDPGLSTEEQGFIRHFLDYADTLLERTNENLPLDHDIEAWACVEKETFREKTA